MAPNERLVKIPLAGEWPGSEVFRRRAFVAAPPDIAGAEQSDHAPVEATGLRLALVGQACADHHVAIDDLSQEVVALMRVSVEARVHLAGIPVDLRAHVISVIRSWLPAPTRRRKRLHEAKKRFVGHSTRCFKLYARVRHCARASCSHVSARDGPFALARVRRGQVVNRRRARWNVGPHVPFHPMDGIW